MTTMPTASSSRLSSTLRPWRGGSEETVVMAHSSRRPRASSSGWGRSSCCWSSGRRRRGDTCAAGAAGRLAGHTADRLGPQAVDQLVRVREGAGGDGVLDAVAVEVGQVGGLDRRPLLDAGEPDRPEVLGDAPEDGDIAVLDAHVVLPLDPVVRGIRPAEDDERQEGHGDAAQPATPARARRFLREGDLVVVGRRRPRGRALPPSLRG